MLPGPLDGVTGMYSGSEGEKNAELPDPGGTGAAGGGVWIGRQMKET